MKRKQQTKILLYVERDLGEKINATFDFVKENWRVWLKFMVYSLLPLCLLQGMNIDSLINGLIKQGNSDDFLMGLLTIGAFVLIGTIVLITVNLVLLKEYQERPDGLKSVTFRGLWPVMWQEFFKVLAVGLVSTFVFLPVYVGGSIIAGLLPLIGGIVAFSCALPFALWPVVYVFEPTGYTESLGKAVKMGFNHWIKLAFMGTVMGLLVSQLQMIVTVPWGVLLFVNNELFNDVGAVKVLMDVLFHVFTVASCFAVYVACSFMVLSLAFHYGSVAAVKDDASLSVEIDDFENL